MGKDQDRDVIANQVEEFLAKGGVIEVVETKRVCPKRLQWIADRGMDYSEWDEIGGEDWYRRFTKSKLDAEDFEEV